MTRLSFAVVSALLLAGLSAGATAQATSAGDTGADRLVHLRYAEFDPGVTQPKIPDALRGGADTRLWIVQFDGRPTEARRVAIRAEGGEIHGYLPENAYVVRMGNAARNRVAALGSVRSATYYHPAFRLEPALIQALTESGGDAGPDEPAKFNIVVVDKHRDKPALIAGIERLGGTVTDEKTGSLLIEASLTRAQLLRAARLDQVLWIDRVTAIGLDMDNARIQGGANYIETQAGYTGKGVNGHVYEGVESSHPDFNNAPINVLSGGEAAAHGHCTAGIVFGNGKSNAKARGMAPDAQPFYTTHTSASASRWDTVKDLVGREVMFTTSSWGHALTRAYASLSADADDIIFDHDMPWTQSMGSTSSRQARPEALAKNILAIGSVAHFDNSNPVDDSWRAGTGSTGPTQDGRVKPDLVAYDDRIMCSDLRGAAGYNRTGDYFANFGGTSGATAIVAGHNALAIQMFTDGLFSPRRVANGTRWQNRPHFTTLKALQFADATQYPFTKTSTDNRREQVGWGFPDLKTMYDRRALHYVVDETDLLKQGDAMLYKISVAQGQPELKISLCFADPAGNPSATRARVNDLSLRVVAPDGKTEYFGNTGLSDSNYSTPGGVRNIHDTVENVFIKNPAPGTWQIEVGAFLVAEDSHVETPVVDADFGLVAVGGKFVSKQAGTVPVGGFVTFGTGCPSGSGCTPIVVRSWTQKSAKATTTAQSIALMQWTTAKTVLCGVDLFFGASSGTVDVTVALYDMDSFALPGRVIVSQKIKVSALKKYSIDWQNPPELDDGTVFFLVFDNADKLELPVSPTGLTSLHYEQRGGKWNNFLFDKIRWQFQMHGIIGAKVPSLNGSGEPTIGRQFDFKLTKGQPATPGVMLLGLSDQNWGAISLPWRYTPTCRLLVSGEFVIPFATDGAGSTTIPFAIPNDKRLVNLVLFEQFLVRDPANPLGWGVSNAGRLKIGE